MTQARLPFSVTASLALHAGGLLLYLQLAQMGPKAAVKVVDNVDLLIQVKKLAPAPQQRAAAPTLTDFLKMALPAIPKAAPRDLAVKLPEIKRPLLTQPKLEDRGRRAQLAKVDTLDLSKRRVDAARIDSRLETRQVKALAALPRLEEVGTRRVRNLPAAVALEERRQEAVALQAIGGLAPAAPRRGAAPAEVLREAEPASQSRLAGKLSAFLPAAGERLELAPRAAPEPTLKSQIETAPPAPARQAPQRLESKKGVEIEGPLADRSVTAYDIPPFPDWAKQQGVIEAAVAIRFWVDPQGNVLSELRVERTSGYPRLDRLAMDSLRRWRFAPIGTAERQWGVITFRFVLE
ncbi:MAG: energy transducer TonB [Elusimicrobia bacterium]|nr:energy transducer TonB [Elusimicrobiota bacterium]